MALRGGGAGTAPEPSEAGPLGERLHALVARGARHRRLVAAVCAGGAVFAAVSALTPAPAPVTAPGAPGTGGAGAAPDLGVLARAAGASRSTTGQGPGDGSGRTAVVVRLADPAGLLLAEPGRRVDVLAGPPAAGVDVGAASAVGGSGGSAAVEVLAQGALVLAVPGAQGTGDAATGSGTDGGLAAALGGGGPASTDRGMSGVVLLAVQPAEAHRLAAAAGSRALSITVTLPPPVPGRAR